MTELNITRPKEGLAGTGQETAERNLLDIKLEADENLRLHSGRTFGLHDPSA